MLGTSLWGREVYARTLETVKAWMYEYGLVPPSGADLEVAAVVGGALGQLREQGDDQSCHLRVGGPKGVGPCCQKQHAQGHADGHVLPIAQQGGVLQGRRCGHGRAQAPAQGCRHRWGRR